MSVSKEKVGRECSGNAVIAIENSIFIRLDKIVFMLTLGVSHVE